MTSSGPDALTPTAAWNDRDLVRACLSGSQQAWAAIVEKYKGLVYSVPVRYRMSPQDAADVFQEVWLDLYSELPNLREPGALRGWLITVAWHKCYQWKLRSRRHEKSAGEFEGEPASESASYLDWKERLEQEQLLREAVKTLPDRCRVMVEMLFFQDPPVPYADVARQLGLAEGSIGFIRGRCLKKLRATLEQMGFGSV
jgi:RNA polymerase sigma factor (sigma-70 family)